MLSRFQHSHSRTRIFDARSGDYFQIQFSICKQNKIFTLEKSFNSVTFLKKYLSYSLKNTNKKQTHHYNYPTINIFWFWFQNKKVWPFKMTQGRIVAACILWQSSECYVLKEKDFKIVSEKSYFSFNISWRFLWKQKWKFLEWRPLLFL